MSSKNHMISRHMYFFFDEEVVMLYCDSLWKKWQLFYCKFLEYWIALNWFFSTITVYIVHHEHEQHACTLKAVPIIIYI